MKSMGEVRFAADLTQKGIVWKYEPETWVYQYEPQKYTPDFWLPEHNMYIEYKGKMTNEIRRKLLAVRKCNPQYDLRLVFERIANKIRKGSPTTYDKWAEQKNFKWTEQLIEQAWLEEVGK